MKKIIIVFSAILVSMSIYSFCTYRSDKEEAQAHVWIYESGFHIGDVVVISDTLTASYRIFGNDSIYDGQEVIAIIQSVSASELVIRSLRTNEMGYYNHLISIEKHIENNRVREIENAKLNKAAIASEFTGIVTTKLWMKNGNLQIKLNNNNSDFPNCFLASQMDSLSVGDSVYKKGGENVCQVFKKDGRIVNVRFINPEDTLIRK